MDTTKSLKGHVYTVNTLPAVIPGQVHTYPARYDTTTTHNFANRGLPEPKRAEGKKIVPSFATPVPVELRVPPAKYGEELSRDTSLRDLRVHGHIGTLAHVGRW